ncbi:MAG: polymer-forming cytoskeletal protein [Rhodovibrionaceae bacterium]
MFKGKAHNKQSAPSTMASAGSAAKPAAGNGFAAQSKTPSGVPSIISSDLRIEGNLFSEGDVQIDGEVVGDIDSKTLTLGEKSLVRGSISAETVRICGKVEGQVKASTVVMTKTARVSGDVMHDSLAIEAGAFIDGHCKRLEANSGETAAVTATPASHSSANGGSQPVASSVDSSAAAAAK